MALDDFRMITLRATGNKAAALEGFTDLSQGDSVKIVVRNLPGADVSTLKFYLFSKAAPAVALITPATGFAAVSGFADAFYATADISSAALASALDDLELGDPLIVRAYVADTNFVWIDSDLEILPSPHVGAGPWPEPVSPFAMEDEVILKADLLAGITPILAMSTLTPAEREARMNALLNLLNSLAS